MQMRPTSIFPLNSQEEEKDWLLKAYSILTPLFRYFTGCFWKMKLWIIIKIFSLFFQRFRASNSFVVEVDSAKIWSCSDERWNLSLNEKRRWWCLNSKAPRIISFLFCAWHNNGRPRFVLCSRWRPCAGDTCLKDATDRRQIASNQKPHLQC